MNVGTQNVGELRLATDVDEEEDQNERKKPACKLEDEPRSAPASAFLIVENGLAFGHKSIQAKFASMQRAYA